MSLDPMMISNILTLLEKKKYLTRKKVFTSVGGMELALTKVGTTLIEQAHADVADLEDKIFDIKDPKKLKKLLKSVIEASVA